jgi:hypothetical protein
MRGRVCYHEVECDETTGYYKLAIALIHRAVLDAQIDPTRYKNERYRQVQQRNKESAEQFLELARHPKDRTCNMR